MAIPTITDYLKYANLQMAAEAFIRDEKTGALADSGQLLIDAIKAGNGHASRFTPTEAAKFADQWEVIDQRANTGTGFSGTLFRATKDDPISGTKAGDLVISFRSTEFIDDAARDNEATNTQEIFKFGFAFGQLADMQDWYQSLEADGKINAPLSVTGYSLGGHLATAFNLMHPGAASQVVTFNGAGIGKIGDGNLADMRTKLPQMIADFDQLRDDAKSSGMEGKLVNLEVRAAYRLIKAAIAANGGVPTESVLSMLPVTGGSEAEMFSSAVKAAVAIAKEALRVPGVPSGGPATPKDIRPGEIDGSSIDYQLAIRLVARDWSPRPLNLVSGGLNIYAGKTPGQGAPLDNQWDMVGTETTTRPAGMVANSQYHYGNNATVFIEDQPLYRTSEPLTDTLAKFADAGAKLLLPNYNQNDFGDTHSLVLIIDSLNVQNLLKTLDPNATQSQIEAFFKAASAAKAESISGTQGKAEGDVLENVLNALSQQLLGKGVEKLNGKREGNTWADFTDRTQFYDRIKTLTAEGSAFKNLTGKVTLSIPDDRIATTARTDFAAFLALQTLSPFVLKAVSGKESEVEATLGSAWTSVNGIDVYDAWKKDRDLTPEQRKTADLTYTDRYLADRALQLSVASIGNLSNNGYASTGGAISTRFRDTDIDSTTYAFAAGGLDIARTANGDAGRLAYAFQSQVAQQRERFITFGSDGETADTLTGGANDDRLYGLGGNDQLDGGKGADYLEGNAGNDTLAGGEGQDTLLGGENNDELTGGKDNDLLKGGKGTDTYKYSSGDGWDTLEDSDGLGAIKYDDITLTGGDYISPNVWQKTDEGTQKTFTYILTDWTENGKTFKRLSIQGPDGGLWIKDWKNGDLGLTLPGAPADTVPPTQSADLTILGDLAPIDFGPEPGIQPQSDALGNLIVDPQQAQPDRADTLYDSAGNDLIQSGGGDDTLRAERGGNDTLEAGSGYDRLYAGAGDDRLKGEAGNDLLRGQEGADILEGGTDSDILLGDFGKDQLFADDYQSRSQAFAGNEAGTGSSSLRGEWLDGGGGEDTVVGGTDADLLFGGGDKDILIGGAGNDNIYGDHETAWVYGTWNLTRSVETVGTLTGLKSTFADGYFATAPESGVPQEMIAGDDRIFGGAGDDWIEGNAGDDYIDGGADNDAAWGEEGSDMLLGGAGDDGLQGDLIDISNNAAALAAGLVGLVGSLHGSDYLDGGEGDDRVLGNGGNDQVYGGTGNDKLSGDDHLTPGQYHGNDIVDGGAGADILWGNGGNDELKGGDGDDHIEGDESELDVQYHGRDLVFGGKGKDEILGGGDDDELHGGDDDDTIVGDDTTDATFSADAHGKDTLYGEKGDDNLAGGGNDDKLYGGEGKDTLYGDGTTVAQGGNDLLDGGEGDDNLNGDSGNDILYGGAGDDGLRGGAGNDILIGGGGTDYFEGGEGNDTYRFAAGDSPTNAQGQTEFIQDSAGNNTVVFETATLNDLTLQNSSGYLDIAYGANDHLLIAGGFAGAIATYEFADGERLSYSELIGRLMEGVSVATGAGGQQIVTGGNDTNTLDVQGGSAIISGGRGNDTITGNGGGNTYLYSLGDGTDTIADTSKQNGFAAQNTLRFGAGIQSGDIKLGLGSLLIKVGNNPADAIHIEGFSPGDALGQASIDRFEFADGSVLTYAQLLARGFDLDGTASADTITGTSIADRISGKEGNDTLAGGGGDDILTGGAGDDALSGGVGNDTYVWGTGDGQDTIDNLDNSAGRVDTLRIAGALLPTDLSFAHSGNDLIVRIRNSADQMVVRNHYTSAPIDAIAFADGTVWDRAAIDAHVTNELTDGADMYSGSAGADSIDGRGGNDVLSGMGGDDAIQGGDGNDTVNGNEGNDLLSGGAGADTLVGGVGADTLDGRGDAATDSLQGGSDGDIYLFGRSSGADTINEGGDAVSVDTIRIDADVSPPQIIAKRSGNDLVLQIAGTGDQLTVVGAYGAGAGAALRIERIEFADATVWTETEIRQQVLAALATSGNDTIVGFDGDDVISGLAGNDTINAGDGNDTLLGGDGGDYLYGENGDDTLDGGAGGGLAQGGRGSDTYRFGRGGGSQIFTETGENAGDIDTIVMGSGILPTDIFLSRETVSGSSTEFDQLILTLKSATGALTSDSVTVWQHFLSAGGVSRVERIVFENGTIWDRTTIANLLDTGTDGNNAIYGDRWDSVIDGKAGNDALYGYGGNDAISGGAGTDALYGGLGNDTLIGGSGADTLYGGVGNDTYNYSRGDGADRIDETPYQDGGGVDTLAFGSGILAADVGLYREGVDLVVVVDNSPNQIRVSGFFASATYQIERILFADQSEWNAAEIAARTVAGTQNAMTGTAGDDTFVVDNTLDTISEGADQGTDTVQSSVSWALGANIENLTLTGVLNSNATGNSLNNVIVGNSGNNTLNTGGGYDTLRGGLGDDTYMADGSAQVEENAGEGIDTVHDKASYDYTLGANLENLVLTNNYVYKVRVSGNAENNVIESRYGDYVDGKGGADTVIFRSGLGNSYYYFPSSEITGSTVYVDSAGDKVIFMDPTEGARSREVASVDRILDDGIGTLMLASGSAARVGTGNSLGNALEGNEFANTLYGLDGNDTLFGGHGADTLIGGKGNDTYYLDPRRTAFNVNTSSAISGLLLDEGDLIVESANEGSDTVYSVFDYTLADNVENVVLQQYQYNGNTLYALRGTGNDSANSLTGNAAANVLDGRGGADYMAGSAGDDIYYVDDAGDNVAENAGSGNDTVYSAVSYALTAEVEKLVLTGDASISGTGNAGNNILDGSQNAGANLLVGGLGDDTYVLGAGDTCLELAGEGVDTVVTTESYVLGDSVENITLVGNSATTATGSAGNNELNGAQNAAANTLIGQAGNDTYIVDANDVIVEVADGGIDTVVSTMATYALQANLENLTLGASAGAATGVGNALDNLITGNAADNRLDGGFGADTMRGGSGNDVYVVDNLGDVVEDDYGNDTVEANVSYTLGSSVESLVLKGDSAISGTGSALANTLDGSQNSAANQLAGGAGSDRYILGEGDSVIESANEGTDTVVTASYFVLGENIENLELLGSANVDATGNALDNWLFGNSGANVLDGAGGGDILVGRGGDDTYIIDSAADQVFEDADGGIDAVKSSVSYALSDTVEDLTLTGSDAINGTGNMFDNALRGNAGANVLQGKWGNDTYYVGAGDVVIENVGEGTDTIVSETAWALGSNVENLVLSGSASINGAGNDQYNQLTGNAGNNRLDGQGGGDTMVGGLGDDTYVVDSNFDVVVESAGEGVDTVESSISLSLAGNVENLTLTGINAVQGTGNALDNTLVGSADVNYVLEGGAGNDYLTTGTGGDYLNGGAGADVMTGGSGDDSYEVDSVGDVVVEQAGGGADVVYASISYSLGADVETLYLRGTGDIDGTGNEGANSLYGNAGNNRLDGKSGADYIYGDGGSDIYVVDNVGDVVVDNAIFDNDTIESSVDWTLDDYQENLVLTGATAINATGNWADNRISGNAANNMLDGGRGNDIYFFRRGGGHDTIFEAADSTAGKLNVLRLEPGISPADVLLARNGANLELTISGTSDSVTIRNFYLNNDPNNAENPIQQIEFADDTVWDIQTIQHTVLANHAPTGSVAVSGAAVQNQVLVASNTLADVDGMGEVAYQWQRSADGIRWNDIDGETAASMVLLESVVGSHVRVVASYTDGTGLLETVSSTATAVVANVNDAPVGSVSVSGDAVLNYTLIAAHGISDADGMGSVSYQWECSTDGVLWSAIDGANSDALTLTDALVGQHVRTVASYVDGHGTAENVTSGSKLVMADVNHAPIFLGGAGAPGVVVTDAGSSADWAYGLDIQADGKYVVVGKSSVNDAPVFTVLRYNEGGSLDSSFNGTGKVTTALGLYHDDSYAVHVQADGKIVVGGVSSQGPSDFALARYNSDGMLDASFGSDGKVTTDINVYWDQAYAMAVQADGKIVLAGMATSNPVATQDFALVRYNTDGSLDTNFNGSGKVMTSAGYSSQWLNAVKIQADGKIVAAGFGSSDGTPGNDLVLMRYNANGTLDSTFDQDGIVVMDSGFADSAQSLVIQGDGKILVYGSSANGACLLRYNANGSLDVAFGNSGKVDTPVGTWDYGDSVTIQADGKILVAGYRYGGSSQSDVALSRYNIDGTLDIGFGDNGVASVAISNASDAACAVKVQADGKIVVVGGRYSDDWSATDIAIARFDANGSLDTSFGASGQLGDQTVNKGSLFSLAIPVSLFVDTDANDSLVYGASLSDGSFLPAWLSFDAATRTFSGTPTNADIGTIGVRVSATDLAGATAFSNVFNISVAFVNSAPGGSISVDGSAIQNQSLTADGTLTDEDGLGTLNYQWESSNDGESWGSISGATFSQIVLTEALVGKQLRVVVSYVDGYGTAESVISASSAAVVNVNDAPVVVNPVPDKVATQGVAFSTTFAANAFTDIDVGDILTFSATLADGSPLPSWLSFDAASRRFQGTPDAIGAVNVRVTATDTGGLTVSDVFAITVESLDKNLTGTAGVDVLNGDIGNDTLSGLGGNDTLNGMAGNDYLDGGIGNDTMSGGTGDDIYIVDSASDAVNEAANAGIDTARSSVTYTLAANVEKLILTGTSAINGTGNTLDNTLTGNGAANTLSGGTGGDTMAGGAGNDIYVVDNAGDTVIENAAEGTDTVQSGISYVLGANLEKLTLTGSSAINATGNELANTLTGNSGNNILDGGAGADTLVGGAGNDTYYVSTGDTVTEAASAGTDTVVSDITWTLGSNLENLTLVGTAAINGTGNTQANLIIGNAAANTLSGGSGADTMRGGAGDDTYVVDNASDIVTENAGEGNDLVNASVTCTLSANVERLTLTGTTAINGTGNELNNTLTGNSGANTLTGGAGNDSLNGGAGADTMLGGLGDDVYTVDNASDVVTENAGEGIDLVNSSITLTLAANIEALALSGSSARNGTGNALDNLLKGNSGANTLNGGAGNDILEGGAGNDVLTDTSGTALFNGGAGTDTITGGAAAELYLGGLGNDTYTTAGGNDVILFNKGDGKDTFATGGTGSDTVSLGGGIAYTDLSFSKATNDLVLKVGATDQITFKNWYAATPSKPVLNLQVIAEAMADFDAGGSDPLRDQKVENFNFAGLAGAFDAARMANPGLTSWALTDALTQFQLAGSDSAALGGDLAYQYGKNGTLAGIGLTAAQQVIGDGSFGSQAQTLRPLAGLQEGAVRLS